MLFNILTEYKDIIQVTKAGHAYVWSEQVIHQALKSGRCIAQAKGHHLPFISAGVGDECCLRNVLSCDPYLVVPRPQVQLGIYLGSK